MKKELRKKRAALYDPFLDTLGGGEKHILSILKVLEDEGYEINIFWDQNLQKQIEDRFRLQFVNKLKFLPNVFNPEGSRNHEGFLKKLITLKNFDIFFYVTDGSYFFSSAKKNFIFSMVPDKELFSMTLINKLKTLNYRFISNSYFTQSALQKWNINSKVIYPYLNEDYIKLKTDTLKKDKIILSIGRFYRHLHSKKQAEIIKVFKQFKQNSNLFKDFTLILAGGLKEEDKDYFNQLESLTKGRLDILFKTNLSYKELCKLYQNSQIYLHFTGYNTDETLNPQLVEHLGIAPLEAMSCGCLTFAYNAGGLKELISDNKNGFLFKNEAELFNKIVHVLKNPVKQKHIIKQAKQTVREKFSYEIFKKRVKEVIL